MSDVLQSTMHVCTVKCTCKTFILTNYISKVEYNGQQMYFKRD